MPEPAPNSEPALAEAVTRWLRGAPRMAPRAARRAPRHAYGIGALSGIAVLALASAAALASLTRISAEAGWRSHGEHVIEQTRSVSEAVSRAESESRAALLTGSPAARAGFELAVEAARQRIVALRAATVDNLGQQQRIAELAATVDARVAAWRAAIDERPASGLPSEDAARGLANRTLLQQQGTDAIARILADEERLRDVRAETFARSVARTRAALFVGFGAGFVLLGVAVALLRREGMARRRAEADARASAEYLSDLYNHAPCGYHSLDDSGRIVLINDTELTWLGYQRDEVEGVLGFADILAPESLPVFQASFPVFRERGWVSDLEFVVTRKDGTRFPVLLSATALRDASGAFLMSRSVMVDLTALVAARSALLEAKQAAESACEQAVTARRIAEEANRELESFSYSVSHDLRAPLRAMLGFAQILVEDHSSSFDPEARRLLEVVRSSAHRMGRLIDDLLEFSRASRKPLKRVPVAMKPIVEQVIGEITAGEIRRSVSVTLGPLPDTVGDPAMLRQVWSNLLSNAFKYTRPRAEPMVTIDGWTQDGEQVFRIQDNGVGFDMRYVDKIFAVFQRLHSAGEFEGTGVGLALVSRILERHGGRIWAESDVGRGATFHFAVPSAAGAT